MSKTNKEGKIKELDQIYDYSFEDIKCDEVQKVYKDGIMRYKPINLVDKINEMIKKLNNL